MLDINWINKNQDIFLESMRKRGLDIDIKKLINMDSEKKELMQKLQLFQQKRNAIAQKVSFAENKSKALEEVKVESGAINQEIAITQKKLDIIDLDLQLELSRLPNLIQEDVPLGTSEDDNRVIKTFSRKPSFTFQPKEHYVLAEKNTLIEFERAVKISGSRFSIMRGNLAKLERALKNFMLDICTKEFGYEEVTVPYLVSERSAYRAGQLPNLEQDIFKTSNGYYLIPTAETSLVNFYAEEIIDDSVLPIRLCSYSPCFRSEAGSSGRDTIGMIRQHQFTKVEIVSIVKPENSANEHERMLSCAETILQKLNLHYRVVSLCSGDIGFCASKTYDIEVWMPGQDKYREICSCSNTTDFQARRAKIKFNNKKTGKKEYPHLLNSSSLPLGRTIIAIMENYQNQDGTISIPDAIKGYIGQIDTL
jgi:seryl-tRNA synthetase